MTVSIGPSLITAFGLSGSNGAGPISAPGVKVGDRLIYVSNTHAGSIGSQEVGVFAEVYVSVGDEIQQLHTGDLSTYIIDAVLIRVP